MPRILLIDDDDALRGVMAEILRDAGHETTLAATGQEGLAALAVEEPDLVLCDINMPGGDGYAVLREVRRTPRLAALPFVFLTSDVQVRQGMASGADDYLVKPVSSRDLLAAIDARLAARERIGRMATRRIEEVRNELATLVPQEIRKPLRAIAGSAQLLREFHDTFDPAQVEATANEIAAAAERLGRMAENYFLLADLELRRLEGVVARDGGTEVAPGAEVEAEAVLAAYTWGRAADLHTTVEDVAVPLSPAHLCKAVSELCDNAFKYTPPGTRVRVALAAGPGGVVLEVADEGSGISTACAARVLEGRPFDRRRFVREGTGVGLPVVRSIADVSGAAMRIDRGPQGGTAVRLVWPIR